MTSKYLNRLKRKTKDLIVILQLKVIKYEIILGELKEENPNEDKLFKYEMKLLITNLNIDLLFIKFLN